MTKHAGEILCTEVVLRLQSAIPYAVSFIGCEDAMFKAFEQGKEPTDLTVAEVLTEFVPLSKLMAEQMTGLRNWVKGRARSATSLQEAGGGLRRIAA